jgi:hypothetical protein
MRGWNTGDGVLINTLNNNWSQLVSGTISLNRYTIKGNFIDRKLITSYPNNGMMNAIKPSSDGGYILCGTVNQNNIATIVSNTKMYLLKVDANLNEQWSKVINTSFPSYGIDVFQTNDGGYLLSGYQKSFNKNYEMLAIKTDAKGDIK